LFCRALDKLAGSANLQLIRKQFRPALRRKLRLDERKVGVPTDRWDRLPEKRDKTCLGHGYPAISQMPFARTFAAQKAEFF